jgi:hypothetical protein
MADIRMRSTEFRTTYNSLSAPVLVTVLGRVIGTYYPKGTEPDLVFDEAGSTTLAELKAAVAEIKHLKSELAKRLTTKVETFAPKTAVRAGFGHSTPAPKGN